MLQLASLSSQAVQPSCASINNRHCPRITQPHKLHINQLQQPVMQPAGGGRLQRRQRPLLLLLTHNRAAMC